MIGIIDYGMGNLRVRAKSRRILGEKAVISGERNCLDGCQKLILPGVGSFAAGMENLKQSGLNEYVSLRKEDTPLLGICLGMQFLLDESEEEGLCEGLHFVKGRVVRFDDRFGKVPHMGWNSVENLRSPLFDGIDDGTQFYFVHSYYVATDTEYEIARTQYLLPFSSALNVGTVYGVQFHPEKSGEAGLHLLENFVKRI